MATYNYLRIRNRVSAKLKQYGLLVTVRRVHDGVREHGTGTFTGRHKEEQTHYMLFQAPQLMDTGKSFIFGADVEKEDRFAIMEVKEGFVVGVGDNIILEDEEAIFNIINVQKVSPGNVDVMYKLHMRA